MTFEEKLNELVNEIEVPDELSPENIAAMLKSHSESSQRDNIKIMSAKSARSYSAERHNIIMRTAAAIAACAVFAAGLIVYSTQDSKEEDIAAQIDYSAVSPNSYDDLYNIYTGIFLDGTENTGTAAYTDINAADFTANDKNYLYSVSDGMLRIISLADMTAVSETELKNISPVDMFVCGDKLMLISEETVDIQSVNSPDVLSDINPDVSAVPAEDADNSETGGTATIASEPSEPDSCTINSRTNVVVNVYDISDRANPTHSTVYKQNGSYTSAQVNGDTLYIISGYCDYRSAPLAKSADLDTFVPAYYLNGEKIYVAAADITVPSLVNSTDYTVVSALRFDGDAASASVKAVLGSSRNVYCSDNAIFISGYGKKEDGSDYSVISSFDLTSDGIAYKASGSVAGKIISMDEYNGLFRASAEVTAADGTFSTAVYVLDSSLTVTNSAGALLPQQHVSSVSFEGNYVSFYTDGPAAALIVDLKLTPPSQVQAEAAFSSKLYSYEDGKAFSVEKNDDGGFTLTMFDTVSGGKLAETDFAAAGAQLNADAILSDSVNSVIGAAVYSHNQFGTVNEYFVFSFDGSGFVQKGVITYNDIDDSNNFQNAVITDGVLYLSGGGRVVSVDLDEMKVLSAYEF